MAKELTLPTPPAAPSVPRVGIGDRIHGIEDRINDIENIGNMNGISTNQNNHSKPAFNSQSAAENESDENEEEQQVQPQQSQSRQQSVQPRQPASKKVTNPESMAREAVANGAGALTKRTTTRGGDDNTNNSDADNSQSKNQSTIVIPPDSALNDNGQSKFERGRAVLKEFQQLDKENKSQSNNEYSSSTSTSSSSTGIFSSSYGTHSQHGAFYWLFTLVAIGVLAFVFVKQFLLKNKSPSKPTVKSPVNSKQSSISNEPSISNSIKTTPITKAVKNYLSKPSEPTSTKMPPPVKTTAIKSKTPANTEDKGKRFEVRI